jgi:hypothetical protein
MDPREEIEDCHITIFQYIVWLISYLEGCCIGCIVKEEEKHKKRHPDHNYVNEIQRGCEAGCMEGEWLGGGGFNIIDTKPQKKKPKAKN